MKKLRITQRNVEGKNLYVIQKKISFLFFSIWVDLDQYMHITKKRTRYYEERLEAKNCIKLG